VPSIVKKERETGSSQLSLSPFILVGCQKIEKPLLVCHSHTISLDHISAPNFLFGTSFILLVKVISSFSKKKGHPQKNRLPKKITVS
jgi:hypothetical protein